MLYARKQLVLLLATAVVVIAAAPSASAELEVTPYPHCPAVTLDGSTADGGCLIHVTGADIELRKHVFGIESHISKCDWEYGARLDEAATGYIVDQMLTDVGCTKQPCAVGGVVTPWAIAGIETGAGAEAMTTTFCVEPHGGGTDELCEIDIPFRDTPDQHQEFGTVVGGVTQEIPSHGVTGFRCELVGHWTTETDEPGEQYLNVEHT